MATLKYSLPVMFIPESVKSPPVVNFSAAAGHTGTAIIQEADIVVLAAGLLSRAATNQTPTGVIAGYTAAAETATFGGSTIPWTYGAYNALPWGFSQVGTTLPANPGQLPILRLGATYLDINLRNTNGWVTGGSTQVNFNTGVGLYLDATTNMFVADASQSNIVAYVVDKPQGPNQGVAGDLGARVRIKFIPSALVAQ